MTLIASPRFHIARVQSTRSGAQVSGSTSATIFGGGMAFFGIYLMVFGSAAWQPLGIFLGFGGLLLGTYLERS